MKTLRDMMNLYPNAKFFVFTKAGKELKNPSADNEVFEYEVRETSFATTIFVTVNW